MGGVLGSGGVVGMGGMPANGGAVAMGGSGGGGSQVPACVTAVFSKMTSCGACHNTATAPSFGGLDLSGDFLPRLLDKPATYIGVPADQTPNCKAGALLIDSANTDNGVLLKKLNGTQDCGGAMPPELFDITPVEKQCVIDWIRTF
jgi:hypothetical protein